MDCVVLGLVFWLVGRPRVTVPGIACRHAYWGVVFVVRLGSLAEYGESRFEV